MKLNGDLKHLPLFFGVIVIVGHPAMGQFATHQDQFQIADFLRMIPDHPQHPGSIKNKIQFYFIVGVDREVKIFFIPLKNEETIVLGQRRDLLE